MLTKYRLLSALFFLIISLPALASQNCNNATRLVTQAYDWGDLGHKDKEKQLLQIWQHIKTLNR